MQRQYSGCSDAIECFCSWIARVIDYHPVLALSPYGRSNADELKWLIFPFVLLFVVSDWLNNVFFYLSILLLALICISLYLDINVECIFLDSKLKNDLCMLSAYSCKCNGCRCPQSGQSGFT
jgi:hypothetical protein